MSFFQAQLYPGQALGFLVLGASLHDILTRVKAEPQRFPKIDLVFSQTAPIEEPVVVNLPSNGVRLRFDGPEQRLRLIEVVDFTKIHITFKEANNERDLMRPATEPTATGPTFKHIYNRFLGPTYDGEFVPGSEGGNDVGTYVLSYPGVAFTFPMAPSAYSPEKDVMTLLSHNGTQIATSMAVFSGDTWAQARDTLWNEALPSLKSFAPLLSKASKDASPDDVTLVRIHGGGRLQLARKWAGVGDAPLPSTWIILGKTSPQDLVAELGPPDAIYRKNEQRMYIHRVRGASSSHGCHPNSGDVRPGSHDNLTDTDMSSANALSTDDGDYDSGDDDDEVVEDEAAGNLAGESFYNYFYLGFDILISTPRVPSQAPPGVEEPQVPRDKTLPSESQDRLVATKMILHGNVPGSYPFNRHRRCRWEIAYLEQPATSETPFPETEERLGLAWKSIYASEADAKQRQRGMVLNRGWGDSPGSSIEFLGGWEGEAKSSARKPDAIGADNSTTTLYGYPGLVFEVLRNGFVSALTVF